MPKNSSDSERQPDTNPATGAGVPHPPNRFNRTIGLYGEEGFSRIRAAHLVVVGLGGVGSHVVVNLARSGVGSLLIVDFDTVSESSLNRFIVADPSDVGRPKAEVLAEHLKQTCPDTRIETSLEFCAEENINLLLDPVPDLVVDAIDSVKSKVALMLWCVRNNIPIVSSMGAAGRRDFTWIKTGDISTTTVCPLARQVRTQLRQAGVVGGVQCVYSTEKADALMPPRRSAESEAAGSTQAAETTGRPAKRLASSTTMPGIFGYALAELALTNIMEPEHPVGE